MRKILLMLVALIVTASFLGCGRVSLRPESFGDIEAKKSSYAYIYGTYLYKERPFGARVFKLILSSQNPAPDRNIAVNFENVDVKKYFLFNVAPGLYTADRVIYCLDDGSAQYTYKPVNKQINLEAGKVYYLGNYEIIKKEPTSMTDYNTFTGIIDMIAARKGSLDYQLNSLFEEDKSLFNTTFPTLKDFPIMDVSK